MFTLNNVLPLKTHNMFKSTVHSQYHVFIDEKTIHYKHIKRIHVLLPELQHIVLEYDGSCDVDTWLAFRYPFCPWSNPERFNFGHLCEGPLTHHYRLDGMKPAHEYCNQLTYKIKRHPTFLDGKLFSSIILHAAVYRSGKYQVLWLSSRSDLTLETGFNLRHHTSIRIENKESISQLKSFWRGFHRYKYSKYQKEFHYHQRWYIHSRWASKHG